MGFTDALFGFRNNPSVSVLVGSVQSVESVPLASAKKNRFPFGSTPYGCEDCNIVKSSIVTSKDGDVSRARLRLAFFLFSTIVEIHKSSTVTERRSLA